MAKVLIVDDEFSYCESIAQQLTDDGHTTKFATTTPEALDLGNRFAPDLLLIEWNMRDTQGGLSIAEKIQQSNPALRIILMTGFPLEEREQEMARANHVDQIISKPFTLQEISRAVSQSLAKLDRNQ